MGETNETHLRSINNQGFLFQLRVEQEIVQTREQHGWYIVAREHRWNDPLSNGEGFIDLILEKGKMRLVLECKRILDGTWLFLVPRRVEMNTGLARLAWASQLPNEPKYLGWHPFLSEPYTSESEFCVLRGQSEKDRPMLERIAGTLVQSVEALAREEVQYRPASTSRELYTTYAPVIVTPAQLMICRFDPKDIDLETGQLQADQAEFAPVPYIRFRKTLSSGIEPSTLPERLAEAHLEQERTVLVVNTQGLQQFLSKWSLRKLDGASDWPWDVLRARDRAKRG